ncbi:MAG: hypothetical protein RSA09_00185 [Acinetobacter sp.]
MIKHKYLLAVACRGKISSMVISSSNHLFPYTEDVMDNMRRESINHTQDESTFLLSITYLGEFEE